MTKVKPIQEISKKWVRNTIEANHERIKGIIEAYLSGKQNFNWATRLLLTEDAKLSKRILNSLLGGNLTRRRQLSNWFNNFNFNAQEREAI